MKLSKIATAALGMSGALPGAGESGDGGGALQGLPDGQGADSPHFRIGTVVQPQQGGTAQQAGPQAENDDLMKVISDLLHDRMMDKMGGGGSAAGAGQADSSGGAQGMLEQIMKQNQEMEAMIASLLSSQQTDGTDDADDADDADGADDAAPVQAQATPQMQAPQPAAAPSADGVAPAATGGQAQAPAAAATPAPASAGLPQEDPKTVLAGDATTLANKDTKCPPGVTMDQLMAANGGVLSKLGNQKLAGDGAKGLEGGIKDNLAKKMGDSADQFGRKDASGKSSQADLDATYRALQNVSAFKNTPGADGKPIPDDIRHNGNVSGLQPSKEVARGSTLGEMQDWFKGAIDGPQKQLPKGDKVNDQGVETSGAQQVGKKILDGLSKVAGFFRDAINATIGKIPGIGKILSAPMNLVAGGISDGLKAAGDAAGGHMADAKQDGKDMGHNVLATVSEAADQAGDLVKNTIGKVPGLGKLIAGAAKMGTNLITGAANVGNTALEGGDVKAAAENMGKNAGGALAGAVVGAFDPTGKVEGLAENGIDGLLGAKPQVVAR